MNTPQEIELQAFPWTEMSDDKRAWLDAGGWSIVPGMIVVHRLKPQPTVSLEHARELGQIVSTQEAPPGPPASAEIFDLIPANKRNGHR